MQKDYFTTSSIALAAALQLASLSKVEIIEVTERNKGNFCFDRSKDPHFDDLIALYWQGDLKLNAFAYSETLRQLKSRHYEVLNAR